MLPVVRGRGVLLLCEAGWRFSFAAAAGAVAGVGALGDTVECGDAGGGDRRIQPGVARAGDLDVVRRRPCVVQRARSGGRAHRIFGAMHDRRRQLAQGRAGGEQARRVGEAAVGEVMRLDARLGEFAGVGRADVGGV